MSGTSYAISTRRVAFDRNRHGVQHSGAQHPVPCGGAGLARCVWHVIAPVHAHNRAVAQGLLPTWRELGTAIPRYFRRSYHPSQEVSLRRVVEYLAASPAARAAVGAVGRAAMS